MYEHGDISLEIIAKGAYKGFFRIVRGSFFFYRRALRATIGIHYFLKGVEETDHGAKPYQFSALSQKRGSVALGQVQNVL